MSNNDINDTPVRRTTRATKTENDELFQLDTRSKPTLQRQTSVRAPRKTKFAQTIRNLASARSTCRKINTNLSAIVRPSTSRDVQPRVLINRLPRLVIAQHTAPRTPDLQAFEDRSAFFELTSSPAFFESNYAKDIATQHSTPLPNAQGEPNLEFNIRNTQQRRLEEWTFGSLNASRNFQHQSSETNEATTDTTNESNTSNVVEEREIPETPETAEPLTEQIEPNNTHEEQHITEEENENQQQSQNHTNEP